MSAAEPARTPPPASRTPPAPSPPARISPRFWVRLDWAVAALCGVCAYFVLFKSAGFSPFWFMSWDPVHWLALLVAGALSVAVAIRRHDPSRALLVVLAACAVTLAFGGVIISGAFVPLGLVLYTMAATRARGAAIAGLAAALALLVIEGMTMDVNGTGPGDALAASLVLIIIWLAGYAVCQRRAYSARVREQVASAAVTEERLRIARELHDVVAHSMTVVAVQAGFGEYVFEREPGEARAALGAIQQVTREALADMQRLLGVLRQDSNGPRDAGRGGGGAGAAGQGASSEGGTGQGGAGQGNGHRPSRPMRLTPAPGLADLERLAATTAGAGVRVDLARAADARDIPAAIDQSAFRIVQEALTNVVKHSGADSCQVTVSYPGGDLCIEITDPGYPASGTGRAGAGLAGPAMASGTGHGIIGMRERVTLCRGEFSAGPLPGQGFGVTARFPLGGVAPRNGATLIGVPRSSARQNGAAP